VRSFGNIIFADLIDPIAISYDLDPEDWREMVTGYQRARTSRWFELAWRTKWAQKQPMA
jgi:hypothetical protein